MSTTFHESFSDQNLSTALSLEQQISHGAGQGNKIADLVLYGLKLRDPEAFTNTFGKLPEDAREKFIAFEMDEDERLATEGHGSFIEEARQALRKTAKFEQ